MIWTAPSLASAFDPRSNALAMLRLGLAGTVAVTHATQIGFGWQPVLGSTLVGELAVDAFFVLSGFLVARSFVRLDSPARYAWHRFLRIAPGFWTCLLLTALVVAPLVAVMSGRPATSVFTGADSAWDYLQRNVFLLMRQFGIAGLPANPNDPAVLNGALWTLFYEALCYAGLLVIGVLGVLKRRGWVAALAGLVWLVTVPTAFGVEPVGSEYLLRFALVFLLGVAGFVFADRIPVHAALAGSAAVLLALALLVLPDYRALGAPAFAYLCLWATVRFPLRQNPSTDLSYGLYIYHYPVLQVLALAGAAASGAVPFVLAGLVVSLAAAWVSWTVVEGPALSLKDFRAATTPVRHVSPRTAARA